jgi:hypothetical protein
MSNHFSADKLKFPGDDRRLDLTDVFAFPSSDNPDKTVLIIDSNPTSAPPPIPAPTTGPEFHPDAVYRINIDSNGDLKADIAFTFTFSQFENGTQTGMAWYAIGSQAQQPEPASEMLTDSLPVSFDGTARPVQAGKRGSPAAPYARRQRLDSRSNRLTERKTLGAGAGSGSRRRSIRAAEQDEGASSTDSWSIQRPVDESVLAAAVALVLKDAGGEHDDEHRHHIQVPVTLRRRASPSRKLG